MSTCGSAFIFGGGACLLEGFDTSGNPVRQFRNQLEITQKINGNQLEIDIINQKSQKIGSGAREGTCGNRLINRLVTPVAVCNNAGRE